MSFQTHTHTRPKVSFICNVWFWDVLMYSTDISRTTQKNIANDLMPIPHHAPPTQIQTQIFHIPLPLLVKCEAIVVTLIFFNFFLGRGGKHTLTRDYLWNLFSCRPAAVSAPALNSMARQDSTHRLGRSGREYLESAR